MHVIGNPGSMDRHLNAKTFLVTQDCLNKSREKMGRQ